MRQDDAGPASPNILLVLSDDMGFSDIGCYGGEISTPNLDRLAAGGLSYSQFYNTARCSPSRASLLTGLHPHQTGIGVLTYDTGPEGYADDLDRRCVTIPEVLGSRRYRSYLSGKWHISRSLTEPSGSWPLARGFDGFYGTITGAGSFFHPNTLTRGDDDIEHEAETDAAFFYTDAISDHAAENVRTHAREHPDRPFFQFVSYTAPHWPLHAHEEDVAKYAGRFDAGWDVLREERLDRLVQAGIIHPSWQLTDRDPTQPPWTAVESRDWQSRRMEVYAAQIDRMDQGIGRIIEALETTGQLDDTLIMFLSDNGGCDEEIAGDWAPQLVDELSIARATTRTGDPVRFGNDASVLPGGEDTYQSYGRAWANLSNTPFRRYKHWVHEGGIATPLIVHWPERIGAPGLRHRAGQLPDIMATIVEVSGATYPTEFAGHEIPPCEGESLVASFTGDDGRRGPLFWEHEGNAAVRVGRWKLVRDHPGAWELYDMTTDRTETHDLAARHPERVRDLREQYRAWAERCGVIPWERIEQTPRTTSLWEDAPERT